MLEFTDKKAIDRASIPVEKIQGPILLISGEEDALWPSTIYAEMIMERLAQHRHPYPDENLRYKGLGHLTGVPYSFPYLPPTLALPPQGLVDLAFGGNIEDSAQAIADSWTRTLAFLKEHL